MACAKKKARREGRTIVFIDESGFYALPGVVKTWARIGRTPVLLEWLTRFHLSVIGAITQSGKLFVSTFDRSIKAVDVVAFLKHLMFHLGNKLLVIWNGGSIHKADARRFIENEACGSIIAEPLPGYAPDLNPIEWVWNQLKNVELRNICCTDKQSIRNELRLAVKRLRRKPHIIRSFFKDAGLL